MPIPVPKSLNASNADRVNLLGLDFGSTTSSMVVAQVALTSNSVTGRMQFGHPEVFFRPEPVFTPFDGDRIDKDEIAAQLESWLQQSGIQSQDIFAGASLITGLAAQSQNAAAIKQLVQERIGETLTATADDPAFESWLAFMGSCSVLSRHHPQRPFLNLDIGGGTTNPAWGQNGDVSLTGCYFIGARHFQFVPGTYKITAVTKYGGLLLQSLGISASVGDQLQEQERASILDFYIQALEAIARGDISFFNTPVGRLHLQTPFESPKSPTEAVITFSGGVGELIYRYSRGESLPGTTFYGDLGIDLAIHIVESPLLAADLKTFLPENGGRATVYGLTLHSTEVSGTTLFLPSPQLLPLRDLPVVAHLQYDSSRDEMRRALELVIKHRPGGCLQIASDSSGPDSESVKKFGERLAVVLQSVSFSTDQVLVILTPHNTGKALGNYATNWQQLPINLIVIDEIRSRDANFVNIGAPHHNIVPMTFYGLY